MTLTSRPAWARGLKQVKSVNLSSKSVVAPRLGAWIETPDGEILFKGKQVAPRLGAWIETHEAADQERNAGSRPAWARGLKPAEAKSDEPSQRSRAPLGRVD